MHALEQRVENNYDAVRVGDLLIDEESYQRGEQFGLVKYLRKNWDDRILPPIEVNRRPRGVLAVMDGGQRVRAALAEFGPDFTLTARIHHYITIADEAAHFRALDHRQPLKPYHTAKAALVQGDPIYTEAEAVLNRYGKRMYLGDGHDQSQVRAVSAVVRAFETYGSEAFDKAISVLTQAYGMDEEGFTRYFIGAVSRLTWEHPDIDYDSLIERMRGYGPGGVLSRAALKKAANRYSDRQAMYEAMKDIYNERRRSRRID